jgi:hypothetical protein
MGFDITFHPVGKAGPGFVYIFDVAETPRPRRGTKPVNWPAMKRTSKMIMGFYYQEFPGWLRDVPREENGGAPAFAATFVRAAAALAGFKYPYWYCRGSALTFVAEEESRFRALFHASRSIDQRRLEPHRRQFQRADCRELLDEWIHRKPGGVAKELNRSSTVIDEVFDDEGRWALDNALGYAKETRTGPDRSGRHLCSPWKAADRSTKIFGRGSSKTRVRSSPEGI